MIKKTRLKLLFYANILVVIAFVFYKIYFNFFDENYGAMHGVQLERIERLLEGKKSFSFAVVGNIKNSIGIFEKKIIPLLNESNVDFVISAGNAVSSGGEDKYRALHRTLSGLKVPYLLTFGDGEHSAFGAFRFYDHYGPYVFAFSVKGRRFVFLDSTGKTSWDWQIRWLSEVFEVPVGRSFVFVGDSPMWDLPVPGHMKKHLMDEEFGARLRSTFGDLGIDFVFSSGLPLFRIDMDGPVQYVMTGGAGGLLLNEEDSFYHYAMVRVDGDNVTVIPVKLDIGQHRLFRYLESLWFFVHSLFYVGYVNFFIILSGFIAFAVWLFSAVFVERDYYPHFDRSIELTLDHPIKVAMFTNTFLPFIGGVPISVDRLRRSLISLGHRVLVVAPGYGDDEPEDGVVRISPLFARKKRFGMAVPNILWPGLYRSFFAFRPDLVHVHHPYWLGWVGTFLARRLDVPVVYTYHTRLDRFSHAVPLPKAFFQNVLSHALIRRFSNRCDGVVVPTESAEYYMRMIGVRTPIFVLPTAIDHEMLSCVDDGSVEALRSEMGIGDEKVLITVSRLSREKNVEFMLEGVSILSKRCAVPFKLVIVGDGPDRARIEERIDQLALGERVFLTGAVSPDAIPLYYHLGDVFVFSSCAETQGMVVLEAMATGLPVVAVGSSGIDDFVKNDLNGYKTDLDQFAWADRIGEILEDDDLRSRLSTDAKLFSKTYGMEEFGRDMSRVYAMALRGRKS